VWESSLGEEKTGMTEERDFEDNGKNDEGINNQFS
jgi:hypothetical protein